MREVGLVSLAITLALHAAGCRACDRDHPYVPPANAPPALSVNPTEVGASPEAGAEGSLIRVYAAPKSAITWSVGGIALDGAGQELVVAALGDVDGDGTQDALYVARPTADQQHAGAVTGELFFLRGGSPSARPTSLAKGPAFGENPACVPLARLEPIAGRGVWVELGTVCPGGGGSRSVFVVRFSTPAPLVAFDALVRDLEGLPKLALGAELRDRDHDGVDDVIMTVRTDEASLSDPQRPTLKLAYFDRPAGLSRDPDEPEASLRAIATQASLLAAKGRDAGLVAALVAQARQLVRATCTDVGTSRFLKIRGASPPACGSSKALADLGLADVRAAVSQGDALRAFAAAVDADSMGVSASGKAAELQKLLAEVAPSRVAKDVKAVSLEGEGMSLAPKPRSWGPLAFDASQTLLLNSGERVYRIDFATGAIEPSDIVSWPTDIASSDGTLRWLGVHAPCDGSALRATFSTQGRSDVVEVPLPIDPKLGRPCPGGRAETVDAQPLGWGLSGLVVLVAGRPVLVQPSSRAASLVPLLSEEPAPRGSPRSPGNKAFVHAVSTGILLRGKLPKDRWMILRSHDLEPYAELSQCVVNDEASYVACVRPRGVVIAKVPDR